jgi:NADH:ubiquinone oxidoreductase subunit F (NADH-binding)
MPRLRPPYIAQVGLFGRPTLEHNFETLYWVRDIVEKGAAWFAGHGRNGARACAPSASAGACEARRASWRRPASRCAS